jgi:hypothetical protein
VKGVIVVASSECADERIGLSVLQRDQTFGVVEVGRDRERRPLDWEQFGEGEWLGEGAVGVGRVGRESR